MRLPFGNKHNLLIFKMEEEVLFFQTELFLARENGQGSQNTLAYLIG